MNTPFRTFPSEPGDIFNESPAGIDSPQVPTVRACYGSLIEDLFGLLDPGPVPQPEDESGPARLALDVDDVDFLLVHEHAQSLVLSVYCTFGRLDEAGEAGLRRVLEINLALAPDDKGTFGADADGHLFFHFNAPLRTITAKALLDGLRAAAAQARAWRAGRFTASNLPAPPNSPLALRA